MSGIPIKAFLVFPCPLIFGENNLIGKSKPSRSWFSVSSKVNGKVVLCRALKSFISPKILFSFKSF